MAKVTTVPALKLTIEGSMDTMRTVKANLGSTPTGVTGPEKLVSGTIAWTVARRRTSSLTLGACHTVQATRPKAKMTGGCIMRAHHSKPGRLEGVALLTTP